MIARPPGLCLAQIVLAVAALLATGTSTVAQTETTRNGDWLCERSAADGRWSCKRDAVGDTSAEPSSDERVSQNPDLPPVDRTVLDTANTSEEARTSAPQDSEPPASTPQQQPPLAPPTVIADETDLPREIQPERIEASEERFANLPDYQKLAYVPDQPTSLLQLPGDYWVAQLMAVSSKEFLEEYAEEHQLRGLSAARVASGDRLFYVLILGIYETRDRAERAIIDLPPPYHTYTPFLRSLKSLQQAMQKADEIAGSAEF